MSAVLTIELPENVSRALSLLARRDGLTPSEYIVRAATEMVEANSADAAYFAERAARAVAGPASDVFGPARAGGEAPRPGDEAD